MTKEQIRAEIARLEAMLDNTGFEDDKIFLLSVEEYEDYKSVIPRIDESWWLRTPYQQNDATIISHVWRDGIAYTQGSYSDISHAVRPAIHLGQFAECYYVGERIIKYAFPWIVIDIDKKIAIAEVPIGFQEFDSYANDYKHSYVRQWIMDWEEDRA